MSEPLFYEWDYDTGVITQWHRCGECNQCGDCCRACVRMNDDISTNGKRAVERINGKWPETGVQNEVNDDGKRIFFWNVRLDPDYPDYEVCGSLEGNLCSAHDGEDRIAICRYFPMSPRNAALFPRCSYEFERVGEWSIDEIETDDKERECTKTK